MALDATVAGESANSYLTVADADSLNAERLGPQASTWAAAVNADKEKALIQATVDIDARVNVGVAYDDDQALRFPRAVDVDEANVAFIPTRIARATYEQAAYLLANSRLLDEAAARRARGMFSFSEEEGPSGSITLDGTIGLLAPRAEALLRAFGLAGTPGVAGGGRIGSVRVRSRYAGPSYTSLD